MAITIDASTPSPTHAVSANRNTVNSASFTPPANSLVVVAVVWMYSDGRSHPSTLSCTDGTNVYTSAVELDNVQSTSTAFFEHYYASSPGLTSVSVQSTVTTNAAALVYPIVLDGTNSVQTGAAHATDNDDGNLSIVTTTPGSMVLIAAGSPVDTRAPTKDVTLTQLDFFDSFTGGFPGAVFPQGAVGQVTKPTSIPGRVWTGWRANMAQGCAIEIIPAAPTLQGNAGTPGPTWNTGQVLAAADCNTWLVPLVQQKLGPTGRNQILGGTILQPDPDLQLPFVTGNYYLRLVCIYDGPTGANLQWGWSVPAGAALFMMARYRDTSGNLALTARGAAGTPTAGTSGIGTQLPIYIEGMLQMGVTPGSLSFLWCQANGNAQPTSVYQTSYFTAWRLG